MYIRCACVARILWAPDQLLHKGHDHHTHPHSPSLVVLAAPTGTRTRRARLQRDGIGAKGTFSPLPVTVNPCLHAMSPLTVVEGSAVAPSPPSRAWLHAGALRVTPILRLCRFPCCRASCDSLLLLLLPPPPRPPPHLGIVGWCGKLVWTSSPLSSRTRWCRHPRGAVASCLRLNSWAWWQRRRSQQLHHCLSSDCQRCPYEEPRLQ